MSNVDNYDLYRHKTLMKYATECCWSYSMSDFDAELASYDKFSRYVGKYELYGTLDLIDPINNIAARIRGEHS
jgi:hypothetical protein